VLMLRPASAGERLASPAEDRFRTLDRAGRADARRLCAAFGDHPLDRIVTSPLARCVETVEPLAQALALEIEQRAELEPDSSLHDILSLLAELPDASLLCTHREVVERLFSDEVVFEKGGALRIERVRGRWVPVDYVAPPRKPQRARVTVA